MLRPARDPTKCSRTTTHEYAAYTLHAVEPFPRGNARRPGRDFWGIDDIEEDVEPITPTDDPVAMVRSLGPPPLPGYERAAEQYFEAIYDKASVLVVAPAAANDLIADHEDRRVLRAPVIQLPCGCTKPSSSASRSPSRKVTSPRTLASVVHVGRRGDLGEEVDDAAPWAIIHAIGTLRDAVVRASR